MQRALAVFLFFFVPCFAYGQLAVTIFEVRKSLAMADNDPVYRDFYVNGGSESGIAVGSIMTVRRRLPMYDSYQNRSAGELELKVAKVKVIHVQRGLSVVRLHSEFTREQSPLLEDNYIMVGDLIDLGSATSESNDKKKRADSEPAKAVEGPMADLKTSAQILVNSVELSSEAPKKLELPSGPAERVDMPVLQ